MKTDAEMILEKHCPSMSNLYLDAQGRNFRDRVVKAMIEYHETEVKKLSKADVMLSLPHDRKKHMRKQATTIFELTKGFTGEPTDNAMKAALEMAGYVQELTTDVE